MWLGYNPWIIFYHFFCKLNFVIFQALLLSTYVDSIYLVRVTPPMNFTFSGDSLFLKKIVGGGHKFSEFACFSKFLDTPKILFSYHSKSSTERFHCIVMPPKYAELSF